MAATEENTSTAPGKAVAAATAFVRQHGGAARGVIENLARAGARLVLIGEDGAFGDVLVPDVAAGRAVIERVEEIEEAEWDSATTAALTIGSAHRRRMAGPRAR